MLKTGVYLIGNTVTKEFYIGSSAIDIQERFYNHLYKLKTKQHRNYRLQKLYNVHAVYISEPVQDMRDVLLMALLGNLFLKPSFYSKSLPAKLFFREIHFSVIFFSLIKLRTSWSGSSKCFTLHRYSPDACFTTN